MFRREKGLPALVDIVRTLDKHNGFGLGPQVFDGVRDFDQIMRAQSQDPSHDHRHIAHMAIDVWRACQWIPSLQQTVDWSTYWLAHAGHDIAVSSQPPGWKSMLIGQLFEHRIAEFPVRNYMTKAGYAPVEIEHVAAAVRLHPFDWRHPKRKKWEETVEPGVKNAARLLWFIDTSDVYRSTRIPHMISFVQMATGLPDAILLRPLHAYYIANIRKYDFRFPGYEWFHERAIRRRESVTRIADLIVTSGRKMTK